MSYNTPVRINELSKELGISSKEIIEKLAKMSITGKTHSSTLTPDQINRLQEFMKQGATPAQKPKAFVVKKAKNPDLTQEEKSSEAETKSEETNIQPRVQVVKTQPVVNRLEIVRRAPRPDGGERPPQKPQRTYINNDRNNRPSDRNFKPSDRAQRGDRGPRGERGDNSKFPPRNGERKPFDKNSRPQRPAGGFGDKKPLERRIIPQDMYDNKSGTGRGRRPDPKKKGKDYKDKKIALFPKITVSLQSDLHVNQLHNPRWGG